VCVFPRSSRPASAGFSRKKKVLHNAVVAATLGNPSSLSLEEHLKKRIEEKYRRDAPDIPMAVWLLRALQRTRVEACASNIIQARCLQDIPGASDLSCAGQSFPFAISSSCPVIFALTFPFVNHNRAGVLHIPSGLMHELVKRFSPTGEDVSEAADIGHAMVDYRKLVGALFPPLIGLHGKSASIGPAQLDPGVT
jgi:hypothetical protein